jgi:virulence factor
MSGPKGKVRVAMIGAGSELYVYGGFWAKNREFIDCLKVGKQPGSHFADALKTMEVAGKILAQAVLRGV